MFDHTPDPRPTGAYAVASEISEGTRRRYQQEADGTVLREQTVTLLLTLYAAPDADLADLRPLYRAAQGLGLTRTLDGTLARVVGHGPDLPVRRDPETRRPWAAVRYALKFRTGDPT